MGSTVQYVSGTIDTLLSTEMDSLALDGTAIASAAYDNSGNQYPLAEIEFAASTAMSRAVQNSAVSVWFLTDEDGTNYEDGSGSVTPQRFPDVMVQLRSESAVT